MIKPKTAKSTPSPGTLPKLTGTCLEHALANPKCSNLANLFDLLQIYIWGPRLPGEAPVPKLNISALSSFLSCL